MSNSIHATPELRITNMTATFQLAEDIAILEHAVPTWYQRLARNGINTEYKPDKFHAIIQRVRVSLSSKINPIKSNNSLVSTLSYRHITALIFRSGRVVLTGGQSERECQTAARRVCKTSNYSVFSSSNNHDEYPDFNQRISISASSTNDAAGTQNFVKNNIIFTVQNLSVCNMVATFQTPYRLHIEQIFEYLKNRKKENFNFRILARYDTTRFPALRLCFGLSVSHFYFSRMCNFIYKKLNLEKAGNTKGIVQEEVTTSDQKPNKQHQTDSNKNLSYMPTIRQRKNNIDRCPQFSGNGKIR